MVKLYCKCNYFVYLKKTKKKTKYRSLSADAPNDVTSRARESRQQQGGDTYTLEIAFPAVKYVVFQNIVAP